MTTSVKARGPRVSRAAAFAGPQTLYAQLRERLRSEILAGRLKPHQQLPSEAELSSAHRVSRITVRQALADLQQEGLVVKVHGKGSFVAPPRVQQDLAGLRGLAESLGGSGYAVHGRLLEMVERSADDDVARALALAPGARVTELLSLRSLDRVPLSLNRSWVAGPVGARLRRIDFASRDLLQVFEQDLGFAVGHAELEIGAAAADREQARHLRIEPGTPVLRLRRVVHTDDGRPLHYEIACYRSDEFSYRLRLDRAASPPR